MVRADGNLGKTIILELGNSINLKDLEQSIHMHHNILGM